MATYYVDNAAANDSGNGSVGSPKKLIASGIALLASGDTLIVKNGTYSGGTNRITGMASGSAGAYTKIYAETDWGVTIQQTGGDLYTYMCDVATRSYVEVRGFKFKNQAVTKCVVENSNHVKIIRCCADGSAGVGSAFSCENSNYVLFEECYSWGEGRYPFYMGRGSGSSDHVIFRRCVCRWDYAASTETLACFANYDQQYCAFQNCIAIDATDYQVAGGYPYDGLKGFFTPNGNYENHYNGCMVVHCEGAGFWMEDAPIFNVTIDDCVVWDIKERTVGTAPGYDAYPYYGRQETGPVALNHTVFGISTYGVGLWFGTSQSSIQNSIIYGLTLNSGTYAVGGGGLGTENYNCFYNNTGGRNKATTPGANDITGTNPLTNSLKYLTRIETGTTLATAGSGGGVIGATILKKFGASGTLWGDSGWNSLTSEDLWPFPNEDQMKADMSGFSLAAGAGYSGSPAMSGARGFCTGTSRDGSAQTFTKYIWEYLGNTIPAGIYGAGGSPPDPPQNLR
jgi:hypothetical protein